MAVKKFFRLINSAFDNGADIVKIQTYEPKDITINEKKEYLKIKKVYGEINIFGIFTKRHKHLSWHEEAFKIAKKEIRLFLVAHLVLEQ